MNHLNKIKFHLVLILINSIVVALTAFPLNLLVVVFSVWCIGRVATKMWKDNAVVREMIPKLAEKMPEEANFEEWTVVYGWQKKELTD